MDLERIIGAISPHWAMRRALARVQWQNIQSYEGARQDRRTGAWMAPSTGPNAQIGPVIRRLRNRARQLVRDNAYASRIVRILAAHQIGYGITPRSNTGDQATDQRVMALWQAWQARCDVNGQLDFGGLQVLAARTRPEGGEVIVRLRRLPGPVARARGLAVPLQLEVVEGDFLDDTRTESLSGGARIVQGVEYAADGGRVAYHLLTEHPGESLSLWGATTTERVPARDVLHIYRIDRPGQVRGVTDFSPVLLRLDNLASYEEAALEKARIEACLTAFVTANADPARGPLVATSQDNDPTKPRVISFGAGMVNYLRPGESIDTVAPTGAGQFEPLALHHLMAASAGAGVTYDQTTGDLRQATFSSLKAGKNEFKRLVQQDQWLMWIPRLCQPVWEVFIEQAILAGRLPERADGYPAEWSPPAMDMVDPARELPVIIAAMRAGLLPPQEAIGDRGEYWRDNLARYAEFFAEIDRLGIVLDSDPRRTAGSGALQPAPDPAEPQPKEPA